MPEMLIEIGLPASGKSTHAWDWVNAGPGRVRINYDDLRQELFGQGWKFNRKDEEHMKETAVTIASGALASGHSVVIDNTNLSPKVKLGWRNLGLKHGASVYEFQHSTPIHECIQRDIRREKRVGRAVIERMALWNGLIDFSAARNVVIVDMDGTMADCEWRRQKSFLPTKHKLVDGAQCLVGVRSGNQSTDPCEGCGAKPKINHGIFYRNVDQDPVIEPIVKLVEKLWEDHDIIVVSGRPDSEAGIGTEDWLNQKLGINIKHLFMRQGGDYRVDWMVKEEILDRMVASGLDLSSVRYVLDDRDQVVEMWRRRGLTCLQVAEGAF